MSPGTYLRYFQIVALCDQNNQSDNHPYPRGASGGIGAQRPDASLWGFSE